MRNANHALDALQFFRHEERSTADSDKDDVTGARLHPVNVFFEHLLCPAQHATHLVTGDVSDAFAVAQINHSGGDADVGRGQSLAAEYQRFLAANAESIAAFQQRQKAAFAAEVPLWRDDDPAAQPLASASEDDGDLDGHLVSAEMSGSVWKVLGQPGQRVEAGTPLLVVEAMKMELAVIAPVAGIVKSVRCQPGKAVTPGAALLLLEPHEAA